MGNHPSSNVKTQKRTVHAVGGRGHRKSVRLEEDVQILKNKRARDSINQSKYAATEHQQQSKQKQNSGTNQYQSNYVNSPQQTTNGYSTSTAPRNGFVISKSTENLATRASFRREPLQVAKQPVSTSRSFEANREKFDDYDGTGVSQISNKNKKLWWKVAESSVFIPNEPIPKIEAKAKVNHKNVDWSPVKKREKRIETFKLEWKARPSLNTKENLHYTPGGGNKRYPTESLEWNAKPKVDSGFLYLE